MRALGSEDEATEADAAWDRLQRRLDAQLALQVTDEDPEISSAAKRLRAKLLRGEGTWQTGFSYNDEVAFGRTQARVANQESVAADVKRCSVGPTLKKTLNGCVQAFNGVHDDLDAAIDRTAPGAERLTLEALLAPLLTLLEAHAHRNEAKPAKPDVSPEGPKILP